MNAPLQVDLTPEQRAELEQVRDHHPRPYMRERAAAILKIAAGQSASWVAQYGLLRVWDPEAVCRWVHRYRQEGIAGLRVRAGRGRKPAFSPSASDTGSGSRGGGGDPPPIPPSL